MTAPSTSLSDRFAALDGDAAPFLVLNLNAPVSPAVDGPIRPVIVGVDRAGVLPADAAPACDVVITLAGGAPAPWVTVCAGELDARVEALEHAVRACPNAARICARALRLSEALSFADALHVESLAYSTLLAGDEFRRWLSGAARPQPAFDAGPPVRVVREQDVLRLTLARPAKRNAFSAALRDALVEALMLAVSDDSIAHVELSGEGAAFCAGGDLGEFGLSDDMVRAHMIRTTRSPAWLAHLLRERMTARVHGACVGAGLEIAAGAGTVVAAPDAMFWLPELAMGLLPGAGGVATVPRRIGRHRACYLALSGARIGASEALAWGLVDRIEERR